MATPVALKTTLEFVFLIPTAPKAAGNTKTYLRFVGNISVMRQSRAAFPHEITPLKMADTIKLCSLLYTKYMDAAQNPEVKVLKTETNQLNILDSMPELIWPSFRPTVLTT